MKSKSPSLSSPDSIAFACMYFTADCTDALLQLLAAVSPGRSVLPQMPAAVHFFSLGPCVKLVSVIHQCNYYHAL